MKQSLDTKVSALLESIGTYRIHGTFGSDFNMVVWQFWLQLPNLMHTNTIIIIMCIMNIS